MPHGLFSEGRDFAETDLEGLESLGRSHMRSPGWWDLLGAILGPRRGRISLGAILQGCSKRITRLKIVAKYCLEPLKWDHNTSIDASDKGEV